MTALLEPRAKGLAGRVAGGPAELPCAPVLRELRPLVDAFRAPGSPTELLARAIGFARTIGLTPVRLELLGQAPALEQAARQLGLRATVTHDDDQRGLWLWCEDALGRVHPLAWITEDRLESLAPEALVELLREHTGGAWPLWLAPEQVRVLPARETDLQAASAVARTLRLDGLRVGPLEHVGPLVGRVASATAARVNWLVVVGATESAQGEVSVRIRGSNAVHRLPLAELQARLRSETIHTPGAGARARDGSAAMVAGLPRLPDRNKE